MDFLPKWFSDAFYKRDSWGLVGFSFLNIEGKLLGAFIALLGRLLAFSASLLNCNIPRCKTREETECLLFLSTFPGSSMVPGTHDALDKYLRDEGIPRGHIKSLGRPR